MDDKYFLLSLLLIGITLLGFGILFGFFICGICINNFLVERRKHEQLYGMYRQADGEGEQQ
jgi:hypothetical protein